MTRASLAQRTVFYLVLAQIAAFVLGWIVMLGLGFAGVERFKQSWDELAAYRTVDLVADSITRYANGDARIVPSLELAAECARAPRFEYAAFDFRTKEPVAGSSPRLVETLAKVIAVSSTHAHFVLPGDPEQPSVGFMARPSWTPYGRFHVAVYRARFEWRDTFHSMRDDLSAIAAYVVVVLLISGATAWYAVSRGLAPLQGAARQVAQIDVDSLNRSRLSDDVPDEVAPFVNSVNEALTRLDAWAVRQRRFTANAAHELRTPLATMRARLDNAKASALKYELASDASQLRAIVEQMLIATRLFEGQAPLDRTIDLSRTLGAVVADLLPLAIDCGRFIDFDSEAPEARIRGNEQALRCVFANLVDNAMRAEPEGGTIIVRVTAAGAVTIADHGEGVAPAHREMIFEPFWRKNESSPGAGLGLAIAKEIVDAHRGRIRVEETEGGGATFELAFPRID
jgi:two-component system OmpR family sensor kinase